jgi:hypothetical protein
MFVGEAKQGYHVAQSCPLLKNTFISLHQA